MSRLRRWRRSGPSTQHAVEVLGPKPAHRIACRTHFHSDCRAAVTHESSVCRQQTPWAAKPAGHRGARTEHAAPLPAIGDPLPPIPRAAVSQAQTSPAPRPCRMASATAPIPVALGTTTSPARLRADGMPKWERRRGDWRHTAERIRPAFPTSILAHCPKLQ